MDPEAAAFVLAHTRLGCPPSVPEIRLYLATEPYGLWDRTSRDFGSAFPFWAFAWAGGQSLARHVLDHPEVVAGRSVLDLGSGGGLVAIAAARAGAASVVASEIDRLAIAAIGLNLPANGIELAGTTGDVLDEDAAGADLVLAGDVFYERPMADRVARFLERVRLRGAEVLVGDPGRSYLPRPHLEAVATYEVRATDALEGAPVTRSTVWRVVPGPPSR